MKNILALVVTVVVEDGEVDKTFEILSAGHMSVKFPDVPRLSTQYPHTTLIVSDGLTERHISVQGLK